MSKKIKKYLSDFKELIGFLKTEEFVFIQPHNFPDHDAVASAFGLQQLFHHFGIPAQLVYDKQIQRDSLKKMIVDLNIDIHPVDDFSMNEAHKIVLVDGCKGNSNVTDLIGDEVAVIDHHQVSSPDDVEYSDIRPDYGACASIIASYYIDHYVPIPADVATALMIGISKDTSQLTRGVHEKDLRAYFHCYNLADNRYVTTALRNYIRLSDLDYYRLLIEYLYVVDQLAFCHFPEGCSQNLLGILADFVLATDEIDFVVLSAQNESRINFSLRSEVQDWDASWVVRTMLEGIGFGGGHSDMAGGVILESSRYDQRDLAERVVSLLMT